MIGYNDPAVGGQRRKQLSQFLRNQSLQRAQGAARLKGIAGGQSAFGDKFSKQRSGEFASKFLSRGGDTFGEALRRLGGGGPTPINQPFFIPGMGNSPSGGRTAEPIEQPYFTGGGAAEPVNQPFFTGGGEQAPIFDPRSPINQPFFGPGGYEEPVEMPFFGPGAGTPAPIFQPFFSGARIPNRKYAKPILGDMSYYGDF